MKDPVCGMSVTTASEHHFEHAGSDYYFCCGGCRTKFAADPAHYLDKDRDKEADHGARQGSGPYICPMCPEVREDKPVLPDAP